MKYLKIFTLALIGTIIWFSCQKAGKTDINNVPKAAQEAFNSKFPNAKRVSWEKDGNNYEAEFLKGTTEMEVTFDQDGKIVATESEISINDVPEVVTAAIKKNYPGYKMDEEADKILNSKGTFYEVEVASEQEKLELLFDADGNLVSSEVENEDEEGDDQGDEDDGK